MRPHLAREGVASRPVIVTQPGRRSRARWSDQVAAADFTNGKREVQYKWRQLVDKWDAISNREIISTAPIGD
jgi:hypothetical protein